MESHLRERYVAGRSCALDGSGDEMLVRISARGV